MGCKRGKEWASYNTESTFSVTSHHMSKPTHAENGYCRQRFFCSHSRCGQKKISACETVSQLLVLQRVVEIQPPEANSTLLQPQDAHEVSLVFFFFLKGVDCILSELCDDRETQCAYIHCKLWTRISRQTS